MTKNLLQNSRLISLLKIFWSKTCNDRTISYLRTSIAVRLIKKIYLLPVKTVSAILVPVILTNILFSIKLNEKVGLLGWIVKVSFLFVGLGGVFCNANWEDIKKNSFIINYMNKHCKS